MKKEGPGQYLSICWISRWNRITSTKTNDGITNKFKRKNIPTKVLRHFLIKSRLQKLFMSSKMMTHKWWYEERRVNHGILHHPIEANVRRSVSPF